MNVLLVPLNRCCLFCVPVQVARVKLHCNASCLQNPLETDRSDLKDEISPSGVEECVCVCVCVHVPPTAESYGVDVPFLFFFGQATPPQKKIAFRFFDAFRVLEGNHKESRHPFWGVSPKQTCPCFPNSWSLPKLSGMVPEIRFQAVRGCWGYHLFVGLSPDEITLPKMVFSFLFLSPYPHKDRPFSCLFFFGGGNHFSWVWL